MKINNSYILLKEIRCYAYHGVAPQENLIGNEYIIDLKLKVDISKAVKTDEVTDNCQLCRSTSCDNDGNGYSIKIAGTRRRTDR